MAGNRTIAVDAVDAVDADIVNTTLIGRGALTIAGQRWQGRFLVNGPGMVDAAGLAVDTLSVRSQGPVGARCLARYTADVTVIGSGAVPVDGTPRCRTQDTATIRCG